MSTLGTIARGLTVEISAASPATYDQTGYEALTYTEIGGIVDHSEFNPQFSDTPYTLLKDGITVHNKGDLDYGTSTMNMVDDPEDAGQAILKAGADGVNSEIEHSVKISKTYASGSTITRYYTGPVFSKTVNPGGSGSIINSTAAVSSNHPVVEVIV